MTREPLPDRRRHWTQKVVIDNTTFYLCVGMYPDGRPGEIFIDGFKNGTFARGLLDSLARAASIALQCGSHIADVVKAFRGLNFPPNGNVIADFTQVKEVSSVADWVSQELTYAYLNDRTIDGEKIAGYIPEEWRTGA